jgi:hypothetical protein
MKNVPLWQQQGDFIRHLVVAARDVVWDADAQEECTFCGNSTTEHKLNCLVLALEYALKPFRSVQARGSAKRENPKRYGAPDVVEKIRRAEKASVKR